MEHHDVIVIGSGFGGSVAALRLAEKGHRVLVIEKGRRFDAADFPETNWDLRRWMWMPELGLHGFFQMSFFEHVTILHGVGVGGGSLVYANTLPVPKDDFFRASSWAHLADWRAELEPHYATAKRMLGANAESRRDARRPHPRRDRARHRPRRASPSDRRRRLFRPARRHRARSRTSAAKAPSATGCIQCGACMTGCRFGAKNTLDKNYL